MKCARCEKNKATKEIGGDIDQPGTPLCEGCVKPARQELIMHRCGKIFFKPGACKWWKDQFIDERGKPE